MKSHTGVIYIQIWVEAISPRGHSQNVFYPSITLATSLIEIALYFNLISEYGQPFVCLHLNNFHLLHLLQTLNKIIHLLSHVFAILTAILSSFFQSNKHAGSQKEFTRTNEDVRCQVVFTHSCMQLSTTRRYLTHETLWPASFIVSIEIALPWMTTNLPSVCL